MTNARNPFSIHKPLRQKPLRQKPLRQKLLQVAALLLCGLAVSAWGMPPDAPDTECFVGVGGIDSPLCVNEAGKEQFLPTTVVPKQDICYKLYSSCVPQPDGRCGWTPSIELNNCITSDEIRKNAERNYEKQQKPKE